MKKKALPPRVKRMKRATRLQSARSWLPKYPGKNIVAGYRKQLVRRVRIRLAKLYQASLVRRYFKLNTSQSHLAHEDFRGPTGEAAR